jgi:hypothetical protein
MKRPRNNRLLSTKTASKDSTLFLDKNVELNLPKRPESAEKMAQSEDAS